jgi:hypothetical protein
MNNATDPSALGTIDPLSPQRKELFPDSAGIRLLPFSLPFINPDVTTDSQDDDILDNDATTTTDAARFDKLSQNDSRLVNQYFSHLFKSASRPSAHEEHRLLMKDGQALENISLIPLEGVKILGGPTKGLQWMTLLAALKLHRSQVSLWDDLTYVMIGQDKIDLLKKPFSVEVDTIKQITHKMGTKPHVMSSRATNRKTEEFARRVFAKLLLSALDPNFKQYILSRIRDSESVLCKPWPISLCAYRPRALSSGILVLYRTSHACEQSGVCKISRLPNVSKYAPRLCNDASRCRKPGGSPPGSSTQHQRANQPTAQEPLSLCGHRPLYLPENFQVHQILHQQCIQNHESLQQPTAVLRRDSASACPSIALNASNMQHRRSPNTCCRIRPPASPARADSTITSCSRL